MNTQAPKIMPVMMLAPKSRPDDRFQLRPWQGFALIAVCIIASIPAAFAATDPGRALIWGILVQWMPFLVKGLIFNIVISISAMALGILAGAVLGLRQISLNPVVRKFA
ncbi:hypothetical protein A9Q94_13030 [Rhodobacterales bacterium 56_14_T64]|nr:hypothetical protein A9Q94_13030 [Rhodobacterales bacterium 56_14_T64]